MSDVGLMNRVGTHAEVPFHSLKEGADLFAVAVETFVDDAMILDLTNAEAVGGVTLEQTQTAAERAGGIRKGDMAFGQMGNTCYFATATLDWLVEQGIKLMGVDSGGVEISHEKHART